MQFDDYVRMQQPALMRFATVLTGRTWPAEDVVSDVLGRAFERWDRIAATDHPHAYVRRMIVNEYLLAATRQGRVPSSTTSPAHRCRTEPSNGPNAPGCPTRRSRPNWAAGRVGAPGRDRRVAAPEHAGGPEG